MYADAYFPGRQPSQISKRFGQIFWGLLFVVLDFKINEFDLIPDFLGYILVALGCGGLVNLSRDFSTAKVLNWVLVVLEFAGYVVNRDIAFIYSLFYTVLNCTMMWFLLGGIMEYASARMRRDLSERASNRRIAYVALMGIAYIIPLFVHDSRDAAGTAGVVLVICMLILLVLILHLIYRVKNELAT